jgi:hypothetical protein
MTHLTSGCVRVGDHTECIIFFVDCRRRILGMQEFCEYSSDENTKSTCVTCCKELRLCSTQRNCRLHSSFPCNNSARKKENHSGDRSSVSYIHSPIGVAVAIERHQSLCWNVFIESVCGLRGERRVFQDWARFLLV